MPGRRKKVIKRKKAPRRPFSPDGKNPTYKDPEALKKYLSERARIVGSNRTGLSNKQQRMLAKAIKRARHLGLLPFSPSV